MNEEESFKLDLGSYEDMRGAIVAHDVTAMLLGSDDINPPIEPNQSKAQYVEFLEFCCFKVVADIKTARVCVVTLHAPEGSYQSDEEYNNLIEILMTLKTDEKERAFN